MKYALVLFLLVGLQGCGRGSTVALKDEKTFEDQIYGKWEIVAMGLDGMPAGRLDEMKDKNGEKIKNSRPMKLIEKDRIVMYNQLETTRTIRPMRLLNSNESLSLIEIRVTNEKNENKREVLMVKNENTLFVLSHVETEEMKLSVLQVLERRK